MYQFSVFECLAAFSDFCSFIKDTRSASCYWYEVTEHVVLLFFVKFFELKSDMIYMNQIRYAKISISVVFYQGSNAKSC